MRFLKRLLGLLQRLPENAFIALADVVGNAQRQAVA